MNTVSTTIKTKSSITKKVLYFFVLLCFYTLLGALKLTAQETSPQFIQGNDTLVVYKDVPGLASSDKYTIRVRSVATNNEWIDVFTNNTYNRANELDNIPLESPTGAFRGSVVQAYAINQKGWSHTYGNIEMNIGQVVEVEIAAKNGFKIVGQDFFKAKVHPAQKASTATLDNGKIYFTITKPAQIYIDINGQMDDYNQAINPIGLPVHAISLFANPVIQKPSLIDSRTRIIEPGTTLAAINAIIPAEYDTLYFKPGVHNIGSDIKMHPGKNIYIPGDAIIYGTFNNIGVPTGSYSKNGSNITIYGYGTISGTKIPHYQFSYYYPEITILPERDKVLLFENDINCKIYGITTVDGANHTIELNGTNNAIQWLKTITWRANSDGLGGYTVAEDCFIRTQDDCSYIKASKRRCTFWKDNNAALFHMATIPENGSTPVILEDCDVLYARLRTNPGTNGGGFQQRAEGILGQRKINVIIRDFRFHDALINMPIFSLVSFAGSSTAPTQVGSSYSGILFQNISIAGMAAGNKQKINGTATAPWYGGIIFDNLTIGGTLVTPENHTDYFNTNEFVKDIWYRMPEYYSITKNVDPLQGTVAITTTDTSRFAIRTSDNTYLEKSIVVFKATEIPGYKFTSWSGDVISTTNPLSVEMNSNKTITANFEYVGFKTLTATTPANGSIVSNPIDINHTLNSTVTLTAKPAIGYKFTGWSGDLNNQNIVTTIVMDTDKIVTANFIKTNDFAVNYGGDQYITTYGTVYAQTTAGFTTSNTITGTNDPFLYQSEKNGKTFSLNYPVDNGQYELVLKFAEISKNGAGLRVFNVAIEGIAVLTNFDIFTETGGRYKAIDKPFQTTVADGNLNINFTTITDNAKISAIQITRIPEVTPIFTLPVTQICPGETLPPLPTTSNNGITGIWSPALNNFATTIYTFTPNAGQYATTTTASIAIGNVTTWNGISWSNGIPNTNTKAIISGNYSQATNLSACSLDVTDSAMVIVLTGFNFTISGRINVANTASLTFENNTNLVQIENSQNLGNTTIKRNSYPLSLLDYTIWSSPITNENQFLTTFAPLTQTNRFYKYNETTNLYNAISNPTITAFDLSAGYLIRAPNTHPTTPTVWNGIYYGVPNNGNITRTITYNGSSLFGFNMIGNPYPSTIQATDFINANATLIEGSLYFWRKINGASSSAYAVYTIAGGTKTASSEIPNGIIQVGQGFFVKAKPGATQVSFTNAMRLSNNQNQFFRTKNEAKDRLWLNLTNTTGTFSQTLVGYFPQATMGLDNYDAKYINDSPIALTSLINNEEYSIQGRPVFDTSDVVTLCFKTNIVGEYTIAIDNFEGVFTRGQDLYLVDNITGIETDLKTTPYTFTAKAGIDNARFSLKYQKTLKVNSSTFNENSIQVYINNGLLYVNSDKIIIHNIKVYDIAGRLITQQMNVNSITAVIKNLKNINQVLIVKIILENKKVVNKKIIN